MSTKPDSLKILICYDCGDELTAREETYHWDHVARQKRPPRCYQCGVKAFGKILKTKMSDEERIDRIVDQEQRWGEPRH